MYLRRLVKFLVKIFIQVRIIRPKRPKISIIIPFSSNDPVRKKSFEWLLEYWKHELPHAQVVVGYSNGEVFCKGEALNKAMETATGRVIVVLDADAYMAGEVLEKCADRILRHKGDKLWFVPYRNLFRLKKEVTEEILSTSPDDPIRFPSPPAPEDVESNGHASKYGHRYGAMCMMFPREAYDVLGCFDERFKGWGGEDIALLRALDTLYAKHKTTNNDILHLWHPYIGNTYQTRKWEGQANANANSRLSMLYHAATRHPSKMRKLVNAGCECRK